MKTKSSILSKTIFGTVLLTSLVACGSSAPVRSDKSGSVVQQKTDRATNRAANRAEYRVDNKTDRAVDKAVDKVFKKFRF